MTPTEARDVINQEVEGFQDLGNLSDNVFLRMSDRIDNDFYFMARKTNPTFFKTNLTVTASVAGTAIADLGSLRSSNCGVFLVDQNGDKTLTELRQSSEGDQSQGWYWDDSTSTIKFTGGTTNNYIVSYIPKRTPVTGLGQQMIVPFDEFPDYLVRVYERVIEIWKTGQNINLQDTLYRNALEQLVAELRREPSGGLNTNNAYF